MALYVINRTMLFGWDIIEASGNVYPNFNMLNNNLLQVTDNLPQAKTCTGQTVFSTGHLTLSKICEC